jgi:hypothetical protein
MSPAVPAASVEIARRRLRRPKGEVVDMIPETTSPRSDRESPPGLDNRSSLGFVTLDLRDILDSGYGA